MLFRSFLSTTDEHGVGPKFNSDAPPEYHDYTKYSSPSGLMEIFR